MGEGLNESILESFSLKHHDVNGYSPLTLAYIGDSIYALLIKSVVVDRGNTTASKLHNYTVKYVSAVGQSRIYKYFVDSKIVSDNEADILRRGKGAKTQHSAKNATTEEYKMATGLEALFGWLYLKGDTNRMIELIKLAVEYIDSLND